MVEARCCREAWLWQQLAAAHLGCDAHLLLVLGRMTATSTVLQVAASASKRRRMALDDDDDDKDDDDADKEAQASSRVNGKACVCIVRHAAGVCEQACEVGRRARAREQALKAHVREQGRGHRCLDRAPIVSG